MNKKDAFPKGFFSKERPKYNGCRNCKYQIEPLRSCEWMEQGGDGVDYLICPRWAERKEE